MDNPEYALSNLKLMFDYAGRGQPGEPFVGIELGPGDSLFSALTMRAFGATQSYLIDVGAFAIADMAPYRRMRAQLAAHGFDMAAANTAQTLDDLLATCNAHYLTNGLKSLEAIPDRSVDLIWSIAVLEHIRKNEFQDYLGQMRRILRPSGVSAHLIDLTDHLGGALNSLRFSDTIWESDLFATSGFYTNRLRASEILQLAADAGFEVQVLRADRWEHLPTPKSTMSRRFQSLRDDDLTTYRLDIALSTAKG